MLSTPAAAPFFGAATTSFDPMITEASSYNNHPIVHSPSTASDRLMHGTVSDRLMHGTVSDRLMHATDHDTIDHATTDRLMHTITPSHNPDSNPTAKPSFRTALLTGSASLVTGSYSLSSPTRKGDYMAVQIYKDLYQSRLHQFSSSLIGRLILSKGDKPYAFNDLRSTLDVAWKPSHPWRLISLGRGYFCIYFSNDIDQDRIWGLPPPALKPGIMRLQ